MPNVIRKVPFLILVFFLSFAVQSAYGLDVTVSGGNQKGSTSSTTNFKAMKIDTAKQEMKLNPVSGEMDNHLYFTGSGGTSRSAGTYYGPQAKTGFYVSGYPGYTKTWYEFYSSYSSTYARSWMDLDSYDAHSISGYGTAKSSRNYPLNYVYGDIYVYSPGYTADLVDYTVNAQAWTNQATLSQDYYSAYTSGYGGYINPYVEAKDYYDWSYCDAYLRSSSYYSAYSPYTSGAGLYGGYKGYANAYYNGDTTKTWQDIYGRGSSEALNSKAYQSYWNKYFQDNDYFAFNGYYHLMQQDSGTTSANWGYAYNTHYW